MRSALAIGLATWLVAAACSSLEATVERPASSSATVPTTTTASSSSSMAPTTTSTSVEPDCVRDPAPIRDMVPNSVVDDLSAVLAGPAFADLDLGASIWIDGWGEIVDHDADRLLVPASNQKLLVAIAALEELDPDDRLVTTIGTDGADLVIVPGGDPTLSDAGLAALADGVSSVGIVQAERLVVDISRYPEGPRANGWLDWQIPTYVGPLSGFMVDDNRWTDDASFVSNPAVGNGERFLQHLRERGLSIEGPVVLSSSPIRIDAVTSIESPPIGELVESMLRSSDNQIADLLVLELGRRAGRGDLETGLAVVDRVLGEFCVEVAGESDDGSGLSRSNLRSAGEFRRILDAIRTTLVGQRLRDALPVGGVSGTLNDRFRGDEAGRVQAKTGTIIGGRALSGYGQTIDGREIVFSIIVNGEAEAARAALPALDRLVSTVLTAEG